MPSGGSRRVYLFNVIGEINPLEQFLYYITEIKYDILKVKT